MKQKVKAIFGLIMVLILAASCAAPPQQLDDNKPSFTPQVSTFPSETTENPSATSKEPLSVEEYNYQSVHRENGRQITGAFVIDDTYTLKIDAVVDVSNVERIGMYEYIRHPITDSERDSLLAVYFGDRIGEVKHNTKGWNNSWELITDTESIHFGYSLSNHGISEDTFFIRDQKVRIEEGDRKMLTSIDAAGMKISLEDAFSMCETLVQSLTDSPYIPDNIRPFKQHQETKDGMLWIIYHRVADGMPITAYNDLKFYVLDSGVTYIHGALYDLKPVAIDSKIISLDDAIAHLQENASRVNDRNNFMDFDRLYEDVIPISEITFEYVAIRNENYEYKVVPVWRFVIGDDEESRLIARDRVISVNALTGELIADRRRATF